MNRKAYISVLAIVFLGICFLTGCSSGSNAPTIAITPSAGATESAQINQPFATQLQATVTANGSPESGVSVVFTAPASGASGTFANGTATETDTTNSSGVATSSIFKANATASSYTVTASTSGATATASFSLTNTAVPTYAFSLSGMELTDPSGDGPYVYDLAGAIAVDVNGDVLGGELDFNDGSDNTSPGEPATADSISPATAALVVNANGQGTLTLTDATNTNVGVNGVITLGVQFVNSNHALITQFDGTATSGGSLDLQTNPGTAVASNAGFAFSMSGVDPDYDPVTIGGVFKTDATSTTLSGVFDEVDDGNLSTGNVFPSGVVIGIPDSYGRGVITGTGSGTPTSIVYYNVGPEAIRLIDVDTTDTASGSAYGQGSTTFTNASLTSSVFGVESTTAGWVYAAVGQITAPASGTFSAGIGDVDEAGEAVSGATISGTYSISNVVAATTYNGYGSLAITSGNLEDVTNLGLYMTDPALNLSDPNNTVGGGGALVVDLSGFVQGTGLLIPQTDTTTADFTGSSSSYAFAAQDYFCFGCEFDYVGQGSFASGAFTGTGLLSDPVGFFDDGSAAYTGVAFAGTPLADADESTTGRYTMFTANPAGAFALTVPEGEPLPLQVVIYQASGTQLFWLDEDDFSLSLGTIEQQGSLTAVPATRRPLRKSIRKKQK
jgi:hypothetical protein